MSKKLPLQEPVNMLVAYSMVHLEIVVKILLHIGCTEVTSHRARFSHFRLSNWRLLSPNK